MRNLSLREILHELASLEELDILGITRPDSIAESGARLEAALAAGHHGTMDWLARSPQRRADPAKLWPEVKSIILVGVNYGPDVDPLENLGDPYLATISVYARNRDYHDILKGALKRMATRFLAEARRRNTGSHDSEQVKVFVDTAPVMEKPLAQSAGLGWQGKHTNLVSTEFGSWLFLGALFTNLDIEPDEAAKDHCGTCRACLDICPTKAFPAPYQLDARRCISYLTIEHKGPIDRKLRPLMGNRIFGCDDCLAVCPWNKFAKQAHETKFQAREDLRAPALADLAALDDAGFRARFSGSPIKRTGRNRFLRNVLIAIGNSKDSSMAGTVSDHLEDPDPVVRGAAVWALACLCTPGQFESAARTALATETDPHVRSEWSAGRIL